MFISEREANVTSTFLLRHSAGSGTLRVGTILLGIAALLTLTPPAFSAPVTASETPQIPAAEATRIITLGTAAGPIARANRSEAASLLEVGNRTYLIDAGAAVSHRLAQAGFQPAQIHTIFLTHLHFDHVAGLAPLLGFAWVGRAQVPSLAQEPIDIYGPPATSKFVASAVNYLSIPEGIFAAELVKGPSIADMVKPHDIDITKPTVIYQDDKVRVTAVENSHYVTIPADHRPLGAARSYSYRFDTPDRSVVFTGDTGPSEAVAKLAKGADVLVSEVMDWDINSPAIQKAVHLSAEQLKPVNAHMLLEHLAPREVGRIAAEAGVKMVVLSHVGWGADNETDMRHYTQGVRETFSGPVVVARDGDEF